MKDEITTASGSSFPEKLTLKGLEDAITLLQTSRGELPVGIAARLGGIRIVFNDAMPKDMIVCNREVFRGVEGMEPIFEESKDGGKEKE